MDGWKRLLLANKAWAEGRLAVDPLFFTEHAEANNPKFLWIGCSDSRVPAETITGTGPGELFVHRNLANLVVHTDFNLRSVLAYAVEHLRVEHIIVCGHYDCGIVRAAMTHDDFDALNPWICQIKETHQHHCDELSMYPDHDKRTDRLVELSVLTQVHNLMKTAIVQRAWKNHNTPTIHGWVYDTPHGTLKDLVKVDPGSPLEDTYRFRLTDQDT